MQSSSCYTNTSGIRDLEQAAEHIAANALYQIEVNHVREGRVYQRDGGGTSEIEKMNYYIR